MILEGNKGVIDAIKEKKSLMDVGEDHGHIRPLLIMDGGFMKGVYGVGAVIALEEVDMIKGCSYFVGVSSGAITLAYTLSGNVKGGATIISEECCSKDFLNVWRWRNPENSQYLVDTMEGATGKRLATEILIKPDIEFYVGVSEFDTALPVLLKAANREDCLRGIQASLSMPGAVTDPIYVNGTRYIDGASTDPHILSKAYEAFDATHVLVITNQDKHTNSILWWDAFLTKTILRNRFSGPLRKAALRRREIRHAWINQTLADMPKPTCFVWGDGSIKSFERKPDMVRDVVEKSRQWWHELLAK